MRLEVCFHQPCASLGRQPLTGRIALLRLAGAGLGAGTSSASSVTMDKAVSLSVGQDSRFTAYLTKNSAEGSLMDGQEATGHLPHHRLVRNA